MSKPQTRALLAAVRANVPVILWGSPGLGKSASLRCDFTAWGYHFETVSGGNREPADFLGLPTERDGVTHYSPLSWARRLNTAADTAANGKAVLFLDELNENEAVMPALLRVLEERFVGDEQLGEHVAIVAAANPADISASGVYLPAPAANRVMHLEWDFDSDAWFAGMLSDFTDAPQRQERLLPLASEGNKANAYGQIVAFLKANLTELAPTPPTDEAKAGGAWPSPRMWHKAAKVLAQLPPDDNEARHLAIKGCVGEGAAREFVAWARQNDLYDLDAVMANPSIVNWTGDSPDRLYVVTTGIATLAKFKGDQRTWEQAMTVLAVGAEANRADAAWPAARELVKSIPTGAKIPARAANAFAGMLEVVGVIAPSNDF